MCYCGIALVVYCENLRNGRNGFSFGELIYIYFFHYGFGEFCVDFFHKAGAAVEYFLTECGGVELECEHTVFERYRLREFRDQLAGNFVIGFADCVLVDYGSKVVIVVNDIEQLGDAVLVDTFGTDAFPPGRSDLSGSTASCYATVFFQGVFFIVLLRYCVSVLVAGC